MKDKQFSSLLLTWYRQNKRLLPWRRTKDPYRIWLSEIILQQTRVDQGLPYYERFIKAYPNVAVLALATEEEVLRLWQGLGYYSRARNLHKCARVIVADYHGEFPSTMNELVKLPGIGRYTGAAIASLAFDEAVPVVDGNVYRLLARYFGIKTDISSGAAYKEFYDLAVRHMVTSAPGEFNQAMMEYGAIICSPRQPECRNCPLAGACVANKESLQTVLPVKTKKTKTRERFLNYMLIRKNNKLLMRQRGPKDIWQGLYEFLLIETAEKVEFEGLDHPILAEIATAKTVLHIEDRIIRHVLSHQILNVNFVVIDLNEDQKLSVVEAGEMAWYSLDEVEQLPKPVLISNYLDTYLNSIHLQ